jgi:hypothetical protein
VAVPERIGAIREMSAKLIRTRHKEFVRWVPYCFKLKTPEKHVAGKIEIAK